MRDDIPDIKHQEYVGKYNHNFDTNVSNFDSDFKKAHYYDNNRQPENTKTDNDYTSNKFDRFLDYKLSKYIQLEEDDYKLEQPKRYYEKADQYYVDNLKGQTLDDLVIRKMKIDAGADDVDARTAAERYAESIIDDYIIKDRKETEKFDGALDIFGDMEEEEQSDEDKLGLPASRRQKKKMNKQKIEIERVHRFPDETITKKSQKERQLESQLSQLQNKSGAKAAKKAAAIELQLSTIKNQANDRVIKRSGVNDKEYEIAKIQNDNQENFKNVQLNKELNKKRLKEEE